MRCWTQNICDGNVPYMNDEINLFLAEVSLYKHRKRNLIKSFCLLSLHTFSV